MSRQAKLTAVAGRKGSGKTWFTTHVTIPNYLKNNRVLVLDINNEYEDIPLIGIENVERFSVHPKIEARRISVYGANGKVYSTTEFKEILYHVLTVYRNGLLIVEDISNYIGDAISLELYGKICVQRHKSVDVLLHFQFIGKVGNPKIWGNTNWVRLHKTNDGVERHKNKFEDDYEIMKIAENIVNNEFNRSEEAGENNGREYFPFHVWVNKDNYKIHGNYDEDMLYDAIKDYIDVNEKSVLMPVLNKKDDKGNKMYTYAKGLELVRDRLFKKYFPK